MTSSRKLIIAGAVVASVATATVIATQSGASRDETRLSNTGLRHVEIRRVVIRSVPIRHGSLLAVRANRALYRLDRTNAGIPGSFEPSSANAASGIATRIAASSPSGPHQRTTRR